MRLLREKRKSPVLPAQTQVTGKPRRCPDTSEEGWIHVVNSGRRGEFFRGEVQRGKVEDADCELEQNSLEAVTVSSQHSNPKGKPAA